MRTLTLVWLPSTDDEATRGIVLSEWGHIVVPCTIQPPHINFPAGRYTMELVDSTVFSRKLWRFVDIPGHSGIEFHPGNTAHDTRDCILPGLVFDKVYDDAGHFVGNGVLHSVIALNGLHAALDGETTAHVIIVDAREGATP